MNSKKQDKNTKTCQKQSIMISTRQNSMSITAQSNAGKVHSNFFHSKSPTKSKAMGSERIIVHLLRLKNPNLHVKKLGGFRLDSFHGDQCIANFFLLLHFLMTINFMVVSKWDIGEEN